MGSDRNREQVLYSIDPRVLRIQNCKSTAYSIYTSVQPSITLGAHENPSLVALTAILPNMRENPQIKASYLLSAY
jgi:hypothetical protein